MTILKKGSSGPLVIQLQTFLHITADGIFGDKTEDAVITWQKTNGLTADGIVGPITWKAMGIATTDISENYEDTGNLTIIKDFLPNGEYYSGPVEKKWIFLHHTAGWHNPEGCVSSWAHDNRGPVATEFILGGPSIRGNDNNSDGILVQAFPRGGYGWHLGTGNDSMHRESVGIEVCNFGQLTKGGYYKWDSTLRKNVWIPLKANSFYTYVGVEAHPSQIVELEKPFRGFKFWHRYSDKQVEVLKEWIYYIGNRDNIDVRKGICEQIKLYGVDAFDKVDIPLCNRTPGVWLHTNVQAGKVDLFPQSEVVDMLVSL